MIHWKDKLRHHFNPLHVYCRLLDIGINRRTARNLSRWYEKAVYKNSVLA
jgi:hypothetical protein